MTGTSTATGHPVIYSGNCLRQYVDHILLAFSLPKATSQVKLAKVQNLLLSSSAEFFCRLHRDLVKREEAEGMVLLGPWPRSMVEPKLEQFNPVSQKADEASIRHANHGKQTVVFDIFPLILGNPQPPENTSTPTSVDVLFPVKAVTSCPFVPAQKPSAATNFEGCLKLEGCLKFEAAGDDWVADRQIWAVGVSQSVTLTHTTPLLFFQPNEGPRDLAHSLRVRQSHAGLKQERPSKISLTRGGEHNTSPRGGSHIHRANTLGSSDDNGRDRELSGLLVGGIDTDDRSNPEPESICSASPDSDQGSANDESVHRTSSDQGSENDESDDGLAFVHAVLLSAPYTHALPPQKLEGILHWTRSVDEV
ncbi:hypothetical protein C8R47DRAFT_51697 [Mycena vitilis]|nr:hypothetical protein C8R47DRAFT_51697 [Mycena vitilis]